MGLIVSKITDITEIKIQREKYIRVNGSLASRETYGKERNARGNDNTDTLVMIKLEILSSVLLLYMMYPTTCV